MTPGEFLTVLDHALAPGRPEKRPLRLTVPVLWGQRGRFERGDGAELPDGYTYSRRQCRKMRTAIYKAAREDRLAPPSRDPGFATGAPSLADE